MIKCASPLVDEDDLRAVGKSLLSGQLSGGQEVAEFEREFCEYNSMPFGVAVNSGTAALHIALRAFNIGPGDEVIVPALTFFASVAAVAHAGATPIFADINREDFCLSLDSVREQVTPATKAIIVVHYFGNVSSDMPALVDFCAQCGIKLIEDCAQSHGSSLNGQITGSFGDAAAFSFFATKHMTTAEGGMTLFKDESASSLARQFISHGMSGRHDHLFFGYNYRLAAPLAALGRSQLKKLESFNEKRIEVSWQIIEGLKDVKWLTLPSLKPDIRHTFFWLHALIDEKILGCDTSQLISDLAKMGIEVRNRYEEPLYYQQALDCKQGCNCNTCPKKLLSAVGRDRFHSGSYPAVEKIAGKLIGLPNRPDMEKSEIETLVNIIKSI